ncbi:unnamed protein product [Didymodactylos carnosus]|uniref:Uncharacterized protein n=1 Tax=Didymodactylos carnosus TaxID=1234261 RepID=A0A814Y8I8_9BILA|nr:unnamed protein product [Didymodactylos carnosus]CAF1375858.1 unnamed protein product [Didymodactylos carnosus]CAF3988801.1 unnamed protein product [Didymodactylos carnosus]CAF4184689.1 unnamed protein product [Didymodactylos carnosus]
MIASHSLIGASLYPGLSTQMLNCLGMCNYASGGNAQGYNISTHIIPYCTDLNSAMGTVIGQRADTELLYLNDNFTVAFQSTAPQAWIGLGGATTSSALWSLSCRIDLYLRPDGFYNSAPVSTMMSPINIPQNIQQTINIPVSDANNDIISCRWASGFAECGDACPPSSLPAGTILYPNCTMEITGTVLNAYYAITIMVRTLADEDAENNIVQEIVPITIPLHVVSASTCTLAPEIIGAPAALSCTSVQVGVIFTTTLIAKNNCPVTGSITEISTLSLSGISKSALTNSNSSIYYRTITWQPTLAQIGPQLLCAIAVDR